MVQLSKLNEQDIGEQGRPGLREAPGVSQPYTAPRGLSRPPRDFPVHFLILSPSQSQREKNLPTAPMGKLSPGNRELRGQRTVLRLVHQRALRHSAELQEVWGGVSAFAGYPQHRGGAQCEIGSCT